MAEPKPRVVTSAVTTMTVSAVRRALSYIRKHWETQGAQGAPLYLSDPLPADICLAKALSIQAFAYQFVRGHHEKRCRKRGRALAGSSDNGNGANDPAADHRAGPGLEHRC